MTAVRHLRAIPRGFRLHGKRNALTGDVNVQHAHFDDIAHLHHLTRILHKAVGEFGNVHQTVLMHTDVDKGPEGCDVRHRAFQFHPRRQIRQRMHVVRKLCRLELRTRITPRFFEFRENVGHGRKPEFVVREFHRMQVVEHFFVADEILNVEPRLLKDAFHHRVRFRMHSRRIQGIGAVRDPQKARRLFKRLRPETRYFQQRLTVSKSTVRVTVGDDRLRLRPGQARHAAQQRGGRRIQIHAHGVHAVFHHGIQFTCQFRLVHIVLILPHADRLRVNLHQFRQGILQTPSDRHRTAVAHVHPGEFGGCRRRSRIHTRPGFAHDHLRKAQFRMTGNQIRCQLIRFAACRAVPDGN